MILLVAVVVAAGISVFGLKTIQHKTVDELLEFVSSHDVGARIFEMEYKYNKTRKIIESIYMIVGLAMIVLFGISCFNLYTFRGDVNDNKDWHADIVAAIESGACTEEFYVVEEAKRFNKRYDLNVNAASSFWFDGLTKNEFYFTEKFDIASLKCTCQ